MVGGRRIDVSTQVAGQRLDKLVATELRGVGRARIKRLFEAGRVMVVADGRTRRAIKGDVAQAGSYLLVEIATEELSDVAAPDPQLTLQIVLETTELVIVDKAAGVPSAPLQPAEQSTVANALVFRYPEMASVGFSPREPGLCHRLDNGTSGLLLAARHANGFVTLSAAIKRGAIHKRYLLICDGQNLPDIGVIDMPLAMADRRRVKACSNPHDAERLRAKPAATRYRVLERGPSGTLVEAIAACARRHQIRAHFAAIDAPLVGDQLYGGKICSGLSRHALHASSMSWGGNEVVAAFDVSSPLPAELKALMAR